MAEKLLIKIITFFVFVVVIGTPFFYLQVGVNPYTLAKILFFQAAVEILFFLWLALAISSPRYRPKPTILLKAVFVFLAAMFIVSLTGIDFWRSFWSTYERGIGLFAFLHLAAFFLVISSLKKELPWPKIFYGSLITSVLIDVIAYIQIYIPNLLLIENPGERPGATFGNPTFMTGYLVFNIFIALYLLFRLLRERNGYGNRGWIYMRLFFVIAAGAINIFTVFFAQTRGDIVGLAVGVMALLLIFYIRPPEGVPSFFASRRLYACLLAAILFLTAVFFLTLKNPLWGKVPGLSRFQSISFSFSDGSIGPRLSALGAGWQGFIEKPFLGWGPGNFNVIYDHYYDPRTLDFSYSETHSDKPHNFFLEYANSGGIFLLAAFIFLLWAGAYEAIKQKDKLWSSIFLASVVSYVSGQFFFFETIGPLLMLYLFLGATDGAFREKSEEIIETAENFEKFNGKNKISGAVLGTCLVLAVIPVYTVNIQSLMASHYQYDGFQNFLNQEIFLGLRSFNTSISIWSPYSWNFKRDYAIAVAGQYFNYPGTVADEDALKAIRAMEEVRDEHPQDAFNHYALVNLYNEVAAIDKKEFTAKAEKEAKEALEISPNRQETYFYLAKTKTIEGDYAGALSILKNILEKSPNVPDAHFYYGIMAFATGDQVNGYKEIKKAINMKREWVNFKEPRTVAGFFADSGHLKEAIELYKTAWGMSEHSDVETEIKLGAAYFYDNQYDQARFYLGDAVKKFDIEKSQSYKDIEPILNRLGISLPGK